MIFLLIAVRWGSHDVSESWQLGQAQRHGEQRSLDYISDVWRTLSRFYHLPNLMTNEANTLKLFQGDDRPQAQLQQQLAQLDKPPNTKGWYIPTLSGSLVTASKMLKTANSLMAKPSSIRFCSSAKGFRLSPNPLAAPHLFCCCASLSGCRDRRRGCRTSGFKRACRSMVCQ